MESRELRSCIEACFPQIRVAGYRRITTGWESIVVEVNGKYIFKSPKVPRNWALVKREAAFLKWLAPNLTEVLVPHYEFMWPGSRKYPPKLAGYRKIRGSILTQRTVRKNPVESLGRSLGRFLTELHGLEVPADVAVLVPSFSRKRWLDEQRLDHRRSKKYVYPLLSPDLRRRAEGLWARYLEELSRARYTPVLTHSDLYSANILVDPSDGSLNGVIDWGSHSTCDPALDFRGLFRLDRRLGESALSAYGLDKEGIEIRARLYSAEHPFTEVAYGVWIGDKGIISQGLKGLRKSLIGGVSA